MNAFSLFFFDSMILDENQLYGPFPAELGLMTGVNKLDINHWNTLLPISFIMTNRVWGCKFTLNKKFCK
jgi:hypothetical protein